MKTTSGNVIYYKFECDDKNRPSGINQDMFLSLSEYDKAIELKNELDSKGINYTFLLEKFNELSAEIISRDYFVDNNCLNQLNQHDYENY
jgi:hypothetical protein